MGKAASEMTKEELIAENCRLIDVADQYYKEKNAYQAQIRSMQDHIKCLQEELIELQDSKVLDKEDYVYLPKEPIKIADILIDYFSKKRLDYFECNQTMDVDLHNDLVDMEKCNLRQIANHLFVYCNANNSKE